LLMQSWQTTTSIFTTNPSIWNTNTRNWVSFRHAQKHLVITMPLHRLRGKLEDL